MKTTIEMAREAWAEAGEGWVADAWFDDRAKAFEAFATLVASAERDACAKVCEQHGYDHYCGNVTDKIAETIRARSNT